jgi:hypothetical protein
MAEIQNSFFYDGNQQYGESELGIVFDTCFRSGVRVDDNDTLCYKVTAGTGNVVVDPGEALVGGRWCFRPSSRSVKFYTFQLKLKTITHKNTLLTGCPVKRVHIT